MAIVLWSNATLNHNLILSNTASMHGNGVGGGVYLYDVTASLIGNLIQGNTASASSADGSGLGGGLNIQGNTVSMEGNTVINNIAAKDPDVGGRGWVVGIWLQFDPSGE